MPFHSERRVMERKHKYSTADLTQVCDGQSFQDYARTIIEASTASASDEKRCCGASGLPAGNTLCGEGMMQKPSPLPSKHMRKQLKNEIHQCIDEILSAADRSEDGSIETSKISNTRKSNRAAQRTKIAVSRGSTSRQRHSISNESGTGAHQDRLPRVAKPRQRRRRSVGDATTLPVMMRQLYEPMHREIQAVPGIIRSSRFKSSPNLQEVAAREEKLRSTMQEIRKQEHFTREIAHVSSCPNLIDLAAREGRSLSHKHHRRSSINATRGRNIDLGICSSDVQSGLSAQPVSLSCEFISCSDDPTAETQKSSVPSRSVSTGNLASLSIIKSSIEIRRNESMNDLSNAWSDSRWVASGVAFSKNLEVYLFET